MPMISPRNAATGKAALWGFGFRKRTTGCHQRIPVKPAASRKTITPRREVFTMSKRSPYRLSLK